MAEKKFRSWVGFREEEERAPIANPVDRIRELESQLADLRSRRDITGLSREEFEILATETAMSMIKSAQAREAKAHAASERLLAETNRTAKDAIEGAENKARSILAGAESRGRKYISTAEAEASEIVRDASREGDSIIESKRREGSALTTAARREAERVISEAAENVVEYRAWLADIIAESERLYRSQSSALSAAEAAIAQSREKLDSAFARLTKMQSVVDNSLNEDGSVKKSAPIRVESKRTRAAIAAPKKSAKAPVKRPVKRTAKKSSAKRK
jgi:vacuolar-type H+-ATPase subunit H